MAHNKILRRFILSHIIILLIPIAFGIFVFYKPIPGLLWVYVIIVSCLGSLTAFLFAYRDYKPIKGIVTTIRQRMVIEKSADESEYDFIHNTILRFVRNGIASEDKLLIKSAIINRLLFRDMVNSTEIYKNLSRIGIEIGGNFFVVIILRIIGYNNRIINLDTLRILENTKMIIRKTVLEKKKEKVIVHNFSHDKIVLILSSEEKSKKIFFKNIEKLLYVVIDELYTHNNIDIFCFAGGLCKTISDVSYSFNQAQQVLENALLDNGDKIAWYEERTKRQEPYVYPIDVERKLINIIKSGDLNEVKILLKNIYQENFINRQLSSYMEKELLLEIRATIFKLLEEIHSTKAKSIYAVLQKIDIIETLTEGYNSITKACSMICNSINEKKKSHNTLLKEHMLKYLNSNYMDKTLCLAKIADKFGLAESYLSKFFKEQTGENFSMYVEKLRIKNASNLLSQTNLSINEIADRIGYCSAYAFRRVFKRVLGVIPTSYRDSSKLLAISS